MQNIFKFFLILLSCSIAKRERIPFWEENSYGEFEIDYFIGSNTGKAKGFVYFKENSFTFKVLGPLNFNLLNIKMSEGEIEIVYKDEVFTEKACPELDINKLISFFNGKRDTFPKFFSCYGWNLEYDGEGGSLRGTKGGEMFFFYTTTDSPFQKFSLEYFKEDLTIDGKLKGIYRFP
ncbi:MAG: hypothetical protein WHV67_04270 [Thermoanaerobaculia bacterium]